MFTGWITRSTLYVPATRSVAYLSRTRTAAYLWVKGSVVYFSLTWQVAYIWRQGLDFIERVQRCVASWYDFYCRLGIEYHESANTTINQSTNQSTRQPTNQSTDLSPPFNELSQSAPAYIHASLDKPARCPSVIVHKTCGGVVFQNNCRRSLRGRAHQAVSSNSCGIAHFECVSERNYLSPGEKPIKKPTNQSIDQSINRPPKQLTNPIKRSISQWITQSTK